MLNGTLLSTSRISERCLSYKMYRGNWAGGRYDPGYGIGHTDVANIKSQLLGLPITVEHEGIMLVASGVS